MKKVWVLPIVNLLALNLSSTSFASNEYEEQAYVTPCLAGVKDSLVATGDAVGVDYIWNTNGLTKDGIVTKATIELIDLQIDTTDGLSPLEVGLLETRKIYEKELAAIESELASRGSDQREFHQSVVTATVDAVEAAIEFAKSDIVQEATVVRDLVASVAFGTTYWLQRNFIDDNPEGHAQKLATLFLNKYEEYNGSNEQIREQCSIAAYVGMAGLGKANKAEKFVRAKLGGDTSAAAATAKVVAEKGVVPAEAIAAAKTKAKAAVTTTKAAPSTVVAPTSVASTTTVAPTTTTLLQETEVVRTATGQPVVYPQPGKALSGSPNKSRVKTIRTGAWAK